MTCFNAVARRVAITLLVCLTPVALSQSTTAPAIGPYGVMAPGVSRIGPIDSAALASFLDDFLRRDMAELHVPGAVVSVVQDGHLVVARGAGVANLESGTPVDALTTVFRVGSISKPFTATAIMQLVESGKLDLRADVNRYLRAFKIPSAGGRPVTIADLLTHTAGFDVRLNGTASATEDGVPPLGAYLAASLPPRVRPPGDTIAYSNHGYTLLGHLIEVASGETYADYMTRHILDPLGMTRSSFRFDSTEASMAAVGYDPAGLGHVVAPIVHPNIVPAASLSMTAGDAARFMIMQLEGAEGRQAPILSDSMRRMMQSRQFAQDSRVAGISYGFFESFENGQRSLCHSGGIHGFFAVMCLWPEQHIGLFAADNGFRGDLLRDLVFEFQDKYFPYTSTSPSPTSGAAARARKVAGTYRLAAHPEKNLEKAGAIRNTPLRIDDPEDGTLAAFGDRFVEVMPGLYKAVGGDETLAFLEDRRGVARVLVTTDQVAGTQVWNRVPWYDTSAPSQVFLLVVLGVAIAATFWSPGHRGRVKLFDRERRSERPLAAVRIARARAAGVLGYGILVWLAARSMGRAGLLLGVPLAFDAAAWFALACVGLTGALGIALIRAWRSPGASRSDRLYATVVLLIAVGLDLFLAHWNLLGIAH